jgi:hypothetical protein
MITEETIKQAVENIEKSKPSNANNKIDFKSFMLGYILALICFFIGMLLA